MRKRIVALLIALTAAALPAAAVTTSHFTQSSEADFKAGRAHHVVATSLGHLRLSRDVRTLVENNPKVSAVYAMAEMADGTVYAGTGPQGLLLRVTRDGKSETAADLGDGVTISSLLALPDGGLLVGTGGAKGIVYRIDKAGDKPRPLFEADGVQYVWAMVRASDDGTVYLATGPTGTLFELKPDGSHAVLLKTDENNLTCLASDGHDRLFVGSDTNGLVYRVDRRTRKPFVVYNAAEAEIGALTVDAKGNLYVGTAAAGEGGGDAEPDHPHAGHPDGNNGGVPIHTDPPDAPPPSPPANPGQPDPVPKLLMSDPPEDDAPPADPTAKPPAKPTPAPEPAHPSATTAANAVYKIDPAGFVTEVFRGPIMVLAMAAQGESVLVATGNDGAVYEVSPAADETAVVAKVDAKQVTALLPTRDGRRVLLGLANGGGLATMGGGYADTGTFTSGPLDAGQVSHFGRLHLHGQIPPQTTLTVATRGGNTKEPTDATWGPWSAERPAAEYVPTDVSPARFVQYRLTLASRDPSATPTVTEVDVAYRQPNLPPAIHSVKVTLGAKPAEGQQAAQPTEPTAPPHVQTITWDAADPNGDPLAYAVHYRPVGADGWVLLKDKLRESTLEWDTRGVADGRYEVKVVATDAAANPSGQGRSADRVADPVLVDNTAPVIGELKSTVAGSTVTVSVRAADAADTVAAVDYAVDSSGDWQAATPSDTMFDSPSAAATLTVGELSPGPHTIAVRVTDARGNAAYRNVTATVAAPATRPAAQVRPGSP